MRGSALRLASAISRRAARTRSSRSRAPASSSAPLLRSRFTSASSRAASFISDASPATAPSMLRSSASIACRLRLLRSAHPRAAASIVSSRPASRSSSLPSAAAPPAPASPPAATAPLSFAADVPDPAAAVAAAVPFAGVAVRRVVPGKHSAPSCCCGCGDCSCCSRAGESMRCRSDIRGAAAPSGPLTDSFMVSHSVCEEKRREKGKERKRREEKAKNTPSRSISGGQKSKTHHKHHHQSSKKKKKCYWEG